MTFDVMLVIRNFVDFYLIRFVQGVALEIL